MNLRVLSLGALAGFLVAVASSCGSSKCNATNCATGCCDATETCIAPSNIACGTAGGACITCANGATCQSGTCGPTVDAGTLLPDGGICPPGDCRCAPSSCATGCCDTTNGQCHPAVTQQFCGVDGQACKSCLGSCAPVQGRGGQCAAGPNDGGLFVTGLACTGNTECEANNAGLSCRTQTEGGFAYPGGFCSKPCGMSACAADAVCLSLGPPYAETNVCAPLCDSPGTTNGCRPGYACYQLQNDMTKGVCWLSPPPLQPLTKVGTACAAAADCAPPSRGSCLPAQLDGGITTGFTGGYCTGECITDNDCGATGTCTVLSPTLATCLAKCAGPNTGKSDCRDGYVCELAFPHDGGSTPLTTGTCQPNCHNTDGGICGPASCTAEGYCR